MTTSMLSHMNPRQFKKLCATCHALVIQIDPNADSSTHKAMRDNWYYWMPGDKNVLPGTLGFGGVSGYYQPEWEDSSAWDVLTDMVFWHFAATRHDGLNFSAEWAPGIRRPRTWSQYLNLARQIVAEQESRSREAGSTCWL